MASRGSKTFRLKCRRIELGGAGGVCVCVCVGGWGGGGGGG